MIIPSSKTRNGGLRTLILYFSATGSRAFAAKRPAEKLGVEALSLLPGREKTAEFPTAVMFCR